MNDDDLVRLAEQATLGALLLHARRPLDDSPAVAARRRLRRPLARQVFTTMLERHAARRGRRPADASADALVERLGTPRANLPRLAGPAARHAAAPATPHLRADGAGRRRCAARSPAPACCCGRRRLQCASTACRAR